jgi:hypothetical protein
MKKKGQAMQFWGIGLVVIIIAMFAWKSGILDKFQLGSVGGKIEGGVDFCPDDGDTTMGDFSVFNAENKTGTESFDLTYRFIGEDGSIVSGTDSTDPTDFTLNCGSCFTVKAISASGADGDSARFVGVRQGNAELLGDGTVKYCPIRSNEVLHLEGEMHGALEARAKDVILDGFMYDGNDATATDYETDGVSFNTTSAGSANTAVGSGGEYHVKLYYRPTLEANVYGDVDGYYILVEASTTVWDKPTVKVNGISLSDVKEQLNPDEQKAYNAYEWVYKVSDTISRNAEHEMDLQIFALSGVDPSTDIETDFASIGAYASSSDTNNIKVGAVDDSSSQTQIHTLEDVTWDIS